MPRKKQRGGEHISIALRDYSAYAHIYCFGDLEGQMPFTKVKSMPGTLVSTDESDAVYAKREAYFPKTVDGTNLIELDQRTNHINIRTSPENDAFVFTGDLVDHGKYDIRWLMAIVNHVHPESLLCCIGNRDYNKLRRIDESYIVKKDGTSIWDSVLNPDGKKKNLTAFVEELAANWDTSYTFAYKFTQIQDRFKGYRWFENATDRDKISESYNKLDNVFVKTRDLYSNPSLWGITEFSRKPYTQQDPKDPEKEVTDSLALPQYNYDELVELGLIKRKDERIHDDKFKCILIHVTNMLMGVIWSSDHVATFPKQCEILNGLYVKYLKHAYFYSVFTTNYHNEKAILSHGVVNKYLSIPAGYLFGKPQEKDNYYNAFLEKIKADTFMKEKIAEDIKSYNIFNYINDEKNEMLDRFNSYWNSLADYRSHNNYKFGDLQLYNVFHRLHDLIYERTPEEKNLLHSDELYLDSHDLKSLVASRSKAKGGQRGGGQPVWVDLREFNKTGIITKVDTYDFKFNIYGHSPQGLVPDVIHIEENDRYIIGVDISNIGPFKSILPDGKSTFIDTIDRYNGTMNAYMSTGAFSYVLFKHNSVVIKGVITKGNFNIDHSVKFPIRYKKSLINKVNKDTGEITNTFMNFKHEFSEKNFGVRDIRYVQQKSKTRSTKTASPVESSKK